MGSGDTLCILHPLGNQPTSASYATFDTRNSFAVLDFDATNSEYAVWTSKMPQAYAGTTGLDIILDIAFSTATSSSAAFSACMSQGDARDIDSASFSASIALTASAASAAGETRTASGQFTDGGGMDNVAAGDWFIIKIGRRPNLETSGATGDAELVMGEIRET